ncbi:MAG TPA: hypothetical protein VGO11_16500 [Chthoniobacteraceae bacterium]|nr:hypothetical protein [Chthoniobacteraceae bacterium]
MSTLAEIEAATEQLTEPQKEELVAFLSARLGQGRGAPAESAEGGGYPRLGTSPITGFPLIICTPGNVINPTAEQLGEI